MGWQVTEYLFNKYWAKVDKEQPTRFHLFQYHSLDVVAVADVWLEQSQVMLKQLAQQAKTTTEEVRNLVLFYIALHDLGKLDARFQSFVEPVRTLLQGNELEVEREPYNHGDYGYRHFAEEVGPSELMKCVAGHHGSCDVSINYLLPEADEALIAQDRYAREEWVNFCLHRFGFDKPPINNYRLDLLAGLCSVSDWIGSSITNFCTDPSLNIDAYYSDAKIRAYAALEEAGMLPKQGVHGFNELFSGYQPRGIQSLISELPLEPSITIVESDPGSGKTEFALAYASELVFAGLADGIIFGLPTQATANGLFDRIGEAADKLFPGSDVTLAHGKSKYLIPDNNGFLHKSNKRSFLAAVSVATVDQILMGVLPVKHNFVRGFGVRKSVLILDEVHSYDEYMTGLVLQVLKGQHEIFGSVILLSATLPLSRRERFLEAYKGSDSSTHYPAVSWSNVAGKQLSLCTKSKPQSKKIASEIWLSENMLPTQEQYKILAHWAEKGAMVCLICNTVADAQQVYKTLLPYSANFEIDLFHARYTVHDRRQREAQVLANYGKKAPRVGRLLVATQVVEQSLDLDFDVMVSQLAPIEFLFQRMGRLWRHDRDSDKNLAKRTEIVKHPKFFTLCPAVLPTSNFEHVFNATGYVYKDIKALFRTLKIIQETSVFFFPDNYRTAIEYVHGSEIPDEEPDQLKIIDERYQNESYASLCNARKISNQYAIPLNDTDSRAALLTREGEISKPAILINDNGDLLHGGSMDNPIDRDMSTVLLSRKWAKGKWSDDFNALIAKVNVDVAYSGIGADKVS
nr:CRISPR-associated helicase/endonuclease Cas3 [Saccharophagus degradans]